MPLKTGSSPGILEKYSSRILYRSLFLRTTAPDLRNECSKTILMRKCFIKGTVMQIEKTLINDRLRATRES